MKSLKEWSPVCLPIVLIVGVVIGWMVAQQVNVTPSEAQAGGSQAKLMGKLPASPTPPSEIQELEKAGAPQTPEKKGLNTREGVLEKLRSFRSGNARPASPKPPPEVQEVEKGGPPPDQTQRQKPTKQGLLEKIRNQPGGPEMIEEAKRRGAHIGMRLEGSGPSLSWLNLFRVKEAEAQGTFSMTLGPSNNWHSDNPYGAVSFYGTYNTPGYSSTGSYGRLYNMTWSASIGTQISLPFAYFVFTAPSDGWYIVNIEASGAQASLKHYEGGTYPTVATWDYIGRTGAVSYPAMFELTAGNHYFYWVTSTPGVTYIYEANAFSL